jgi:nucleoside-diphosphate-sugar epimerase
VSELAKPRLAAAPLRAGIVALGPRGLGPWQLVPVVGYFRAMSSLAGQRLVIFGCGYVGAALADAARREGAHVIALTRNVGKAAALAARGIEVVVGQLDAADWHDRIAPGADVVANTVSASDSTVDGYRRSYVDGMRSILAWAARGSRPVGTLVYTSSTGVYPQGGGAEVDETAPTAGASPTGQVLVEAEAQLRGAPSGAVDRWFILRLAGIYGPGRHHLLNALRAGTTQFAGEPTFRLNLAHRDDIVSAVLACAAAPAAVRNEIFNVADDAPATRGEVLEWLARELALPRPTVGGVAVASARKGGAPTPDRIVRAQKIRRLLGWAPQFADFRAGYRAILAGGTPAQL